MPEPWTVVSSTVTYRDRWISIRSDNCLASDGQLIAPYHVLEYPAWVQTVALTSSADIILVREYRHGAGAVLTQIPAGTMEPRDDGSEAAARRELQEETGFTSPEFIAIGRFYANPANQNNVSWAFLALGCQQTHPQQLDFEEEIEVVRLPFIDFLTQLWKGDALVHGLHVGAIHFALQYIIQSKREDLANIRRVYFASIGELAESSPQQYR